MPEKTDEPKIYYKYSTSHPELNADPEIDQIEWDPPAPVKPLLEPAPTYYPVNGDNEALVWHEQVLPTLKIAELNYEEYAHFSEMLMRYKFAMGIEKAVSCPLVLPIEDEAEGDDPGMIE